MVRQMVLINILVGILIGFVHYGRLFTQSKVYSVFPSSLLSYTIDKILASKRFLFFLSMIINLCAF